jgi:hypothetical protein
VTTPGRLVLGVHGTNRYAVRVFDDLDKEITIVVIASPCPCDPGFVASSAARFNLPVMIDDFQGLPSLQVSLPMKIGLCIHSALLGLGPGWDRAQQ